MQAGTNLSLAVDLGDDQNAPAKPLEPTPLVPLSYYPNEPIIREPPPPPPHSSVADIVTPAEARQALVLPPDCGMWRRRLFHIEQPEQMSRATFCQYWPFVSNIWSAHNSHTSKSGEKRSYFFRCRLHAKAVRPVEGRGIRATLRRDGHGCPARLTITHHIAPDTFHLARSRPRKNAPAAGHSHSLDLSDQTKKNDFIRYVCAAEISNGYTPGQIHTTLTGSNGRNPAMEVALREAGGSYLSAQDIRNYGASWLREHKDPRFIGTSYSVDHQIEEVRSHLLYESAPDWLFEDYEVTRADSHRARGIVWMKKDRIVTLQQFGTLFLLDATHDTNWLGWQMYTILLRDSVSSWVPAAHILTATQDANVLSRGLLQLKVWCGGNAGADLYGFHSRWDPHYIVTDDFKC